MSLVLSMMRNYLRIRGPTTDRGWQSALCPFHEDRTASFGVQIHTGAAHCYVCGSFNLKTVMSRVGVPLSTQTEVLRSLVYDRSGGVGTPVALPTEDRREYILDEFVLSRMLPVENPETVGTGFTCDTLRHFDVLEDPVTNRIVWPIRDTLGRLRAVSGRHRIREASYAKYKVYKEEFQDLYPGYEPNNRKWLFGFEFIFPRIYRGEEVDLYLVEGYKATAWVYQSGLTTVAAVMGNQLSPDQFTLLSLLNIRKITLFFDNNKAGWKGTQASGDMLLPFFSVYVGTYPDEREQPDDLTSEEVVTAMVSNAIPFTEWSFAMRKRQSMTASGNMYGSPQKSGGGGFGSSQRLDVPIRLNRPVRGRFVPGEYQQLLWDNQQGAVVQVTGESFYKTIHWSPYEVSKGLVRLDDQFEYNKNAWGGPIECTAGPNLENPQPCVGCYLNSQWYTTGDGKSKPQATLENQRQFTFVVLHYFHPVQKMSNNGKPYTDWEFCEKDERTGRGHCQNCTIGLERVWGRRMYVELKYFPGEKKGPTYALYEFNDRIAQGGVCGCTVFAQAFYCENCDGLILNLDNSDMSDQQAALYAATPQTCPHCAHYGPVLEELNCDRMTQQGHQIQTCPGVEARSIWNTDVIISSRKEGVGEAAKWVTTFEAGVSGPLPYAPPEVQNWPEAWERLNKPFDFAGGITHLSIPQQLQKVGMSHNPFVEDTYTPNEAPSVSPPPTPPGATAPGMSYTDEEPEY